jgi:hypothetical protein
MYRIVLPKRNKEGSPILREMKCFDSTFSMDNQLPASGKDAATRTSVHRYSSGV